MKFSVDHLPITARRIADVIGLDATLALVVAMGGRSPVPGWSNHQAEIADAIGDELATRLGDIFKRDPLPIPTCDKALRAAVRQGIRDEFDRLTKTGMTARAAVDRLAGRPPLRYTDRHIWRLLSKIDDGEVVDVQQLDLF